MLDFNIVKEKADIQFQEEWNELQNTLLEDPTLKELADAILKLREMPENVKLTLSEMLCDICPATFLKDFSIILNSNEFIRLPNALDSLITQLRYNILDDGYIRLFKVVVEEDFNGKKSMVVNYFLTTDENTESVQLALKQINKDGTVKYIKPKVVSVKKAYFGQVEEFTRMLKVFGDKKNWKGFDFIADKKLEEIFCFYECKELNVEASLSKTVSQLFHYL